MALLYEPENDVCQAQIKIGEVSSVNPAKMTARVVFDDDNSVVSAELQIVTKNTFSNQDFWVPDVGEDVICLFMSSGCESGFILGSVYADEVSPSGGSTEVRKVQFSDGSIFQFDRSASTFYIEIGSSKVSIDKSSVTVETSETVNVKGGSTVNVEGGSVVNVSGGAAINLDAPAVNITVGGTTMTLNGSSSTIKASQLTFEGSMTVTGDLTVDGNVSVQGTGTFTGNVSAPNIN